MIGNFMKNIVICIFSFVAIFSQLFAGIYDCKFLLIADAQYATFKPKMNREYRLSLEKIDEIALSQKNENINWTVDLGDIIDGGFRHFAEILPRYKNLPQPVYHVLGNHDFACKKEEQEKVLDLLFKDKKSYYSFEKGKWKFIVLDAMRLSKIEKIYPKEYKEEFKKLYAKLTEENAPNAKSWNGGIDAEQRKWLISELEDAKKSSKQVIVFCHIPIFPVNGEALYNGAELANVFKKYKCVKAYIAGHYHGGGYAEVDGIHYITICGLVEGKKISYATVTLSKKSLVIKGFGRQKSMELKLR